MKRMLLFCVACLLFAASHGPASAGWTVTNLHPAGASYSRAFGVSDGQQVGGAYVDGKYRASLWSGTAESWGNLHPAGASSSYAYGVSGGQQVGYALVGGDIHASLWSGTAESWVDLNPAVASHSYAHGVSGGQQVGCAEVGGKDRASLWSGTGESWVDLHPGGASWSLAYGVSGGRQVGSADGHASLWSGTAESWVDLHALLPAEYDSSLADGIFTSGVDTWVAGSAHNTSLGRDEAFLWHHVVPEPATILALLCGLGGLVWRSRKRAQA